MNKVIYEIGTEVIVRNQSLGIIQNVRLNVLGLGSIEYLISPVGMKRRWYLDNEVSLTDY